MSLFDISPPPEIKYKYQKPDYLEPKSWFDKAGFAAAGFKPTGERNDFGKLLSWIPGVNIATDLAFKGYAKKHGADDTVENVNTSLQKDIGKTEAVAGLGLGLANPAFLGQGIGLATAGLGQTVSVPDINLGFQQNKGQQFFFADGGTVNEDISMVDKSTGKKVGEISYGERVFSKEATSIIDKLAKSKDYHALGKFVHSEVGKQDGDTFQCPPYCEEQEEGADYFKLAMGGKLSPHKASEILSDGTVHGKAITDKQKRFFRAVSHGWSPNKIQDGGKIAYYAKGGVVSDPAIPPEYLEMIKSYFPPQDWDIALKILKKESSGNPDSTHQNSNGTTDYGLFQVNSVHEKELKDAGIITSLDDLKNPKINFEAARFVKNNDDKGWKQWSTYNSVVNEAPTELAQAHRDYGGPPAPPGLTDDFGLDVFKANNPNANYTQPAPRLGLAPLGEDQALHFDFSELGKLFGGSSDVSRETSTAPQLANNDFNLYRGSGGGNPPAVTKTATPFSFSQEEIGALPTSKGLAMPGETPVSLKSDSGWTPDFTGYTGSGVAKTPIDAKGIFNSIGGVNGLFDIAKFATGLIGANKKLPEWQIPYDWTNYLGKTRQYADEGLRPAERAAVGNDLNSNYVRDVTNIRNNSSGSSAFFAGNEGAAINRLNAGALGLEALDARTRRANLSQYGEAASRDVPIRRQQFEDQYGQALQTKTSASQVAQEGLQGLFDQTQNYRFTGPGSTYDQLLQQQVDYYKKLNGINWTQWADNI